MAKIISKLQPGTLWRHKKYGFTIRLIGKHRWKIIFEVAKGEMPPSMRPDTIFDTDLNTYKVYSRDNIKQNFELISGYKAAYLLGVKEIPIQIEDKWEIG